VKNEKSFIIKFSLDNGLSPDRNSIKRILSDMEGMYLDNSKLKEMLNSGDIVVYEFYDLGMPENPGELAYGTTILYPGKVGNEYFMTKGHFHAKIDTAEIYYCIKGHGYLLMENPNGDVEFQEMKPGISVYVPEPLIMFFAFRADAGHDYKTIETKGFRKLIIERDGKPEIIDNPKWKQ